MSEMTHEFGVLSLYGLLFRIQELGFRGCDAMSLSERGLARVSLV